MRPPCHTFDLVVIGGGPAGQKAAVQGAKAELRVLMVHDERVVGGACVRQGTIPSKTLRETAVVLTGFQKRSGNVIDVSLREDVELQSLMSRMNHVVTAHEAYMTEQVRRNGIERWHGRASFVSPFEIEVQSVDGLRRRVRAPAFVIATGSRPRDPDGIPVDHERILDSDSILSLTYLPRSLTVLGGGIVGCEYASIFASLGVQVYILDRQPRPLGFLDEEVVRAFVSSFEQRGGRFVGPCRVEAVTVDDDGNVVTRLNDGSTVTSEKMLVAMGRVANLERLNLAAADLTANAAGRLDVDEHCRTRAKHIYAVGDVIGPPGLASASMEQGRRAACHAAGIECTAGSELIPTGVYTIPEIASVGLTEEQARARHGAVLVGRAKFSEVARGQIAAIDDGLLKIVADASGRELLGVQVVGEGATELVHVAQMALVGKLGVDALVDNIFNFPTLAEAYRVAALDVLRQRPEAPSPWEERLGEPPVRGQVQVVRH